MVWDGEKLRSVAKDKGVSLSRLAEVLDVSRQTVNDWLRGQVPKGHHLIEMSRLLEVRPGYFFQTDTPAPISIPVHRKRGPAKLNERMKEETLKMAEQYQGFFKSAPEPGIVPVMRIERRDEETVILVAKNLRELSGIDQNRPMDYDHTFRLLHTLRIATIFRQFPKNLKAYAFYCRIHGHRVVFVNCDTNVLDLIFPLLHETVHAIRDEENGGAPDIEEETFCDAVSNWVQFPEEYVSLVFETVRGRNAGTLINMLKEFSIKNAHSMFGIVENLKRLDPELNIEVGGANSNLRKLFPSIGDVLFKEQDARAFLANLMRFSPLFFEILLNQVQNATTRKVGEWLGLESILDTDQVLRELRRISVEQEN